MVGALVFARNQNRYLKIIRYAHFYPKTVTFPNSFKYLLICVFLKMNLLRIKMKRIQMDKVNMTKIFTLGADFFSDTLKLRLFYKSFCRANFKFI